MSLTYDVIVIGGGAAGMIAAVKAAEKKKKVLLLEKADRVGRKILASGNGRCNLMNSAELRYYGDESFAQQVFLQCPRNMLTCFFRDYGLFLSEEEEGRVYPVTHQSVSVVSVLKNAMSINSVNTIFNKTVSGVEKNKNGFIVITGSEQYESEKLIVACGGKAQGRLGGNEDGYRILQRFGHTMIPVKPALVPMTTDAKSISGLSGIRIRCGVTLIHGNTTLHNEEGEVLFTDYGISGICIMQCARFAEQPGTYIRLDLVRDMFSDNREAFSELKRRRRVFAACSPVWMLNGILPEKVSFAVLKQAGLDMRGETAADISDEFLEQIIHTARNYSIRITGTRGFEHAQVTAGGISCSEFEALTMSSRIVTGLYAAGEVLNVDGDCGGFNLMFAFASGMIAGMNI